MTPIRVLIADDQNLFAESLKYVLAGAADGKIEVIDVAENGEEAVRAAAEKRPDVILMDIRMPVMDGVDATAIIHRDCPNIKILILTTFDDDELAMKALSQGASGYVLKSVDPEDLILSIESLLKGAFVISDSVGVKLFDHNRPRESEAEKEQETIVLGLLIRHFPALSLREAQVAELAAQALSNKEIGQAFSISERTVKNHLSSVYDKLGIHKRLELIHCLNELRQTHEGSSGR